MLQPHLLIIHLSDIHLKDQKDPVLKRAEALVAAIRPSLPNAGLIIIAITGDIAQFGHAAEYKLANRLLADLKSRLKGETSVPLHIVMAPGNHDCDFRGDQHTRQLVIEEVLKRGSGLPEDFLKTAVKVQSEYFKFRASVENRDSKIFDSKLLTTYSYKHAGVRVSFDCFNASWMSTRHEQQGGLLFPYEEFTDALPADTDIRLCLLHHPLNWYSQSNYRGFRSYLQRRADIVLTGHEHQGAGRNVDDADDGRCVYIEGEALQTGKVHHSAFNILTIDVETRRFRLENLQFRDGRYTSTKQVDWEHFKSLEKKVHSNFTFSAAFAEILKDPGATLKHASGRELTLEDFYVFPDLDDRSDKKTSKEKAKAAQLNSSSLVRADKLTNDIVIQGDDEAGKTKLLCRLVVEYAEQGYCPLLLRGERLKSSTIASVEVEILSAFVAQYGADDRLRFEQTSANDKIALIDDFDAAPLNAERKAVLLKELKLRFHRIILTVGENFEVSELFGGEDILTLAEMRAVKILPFGHARRRELIQKWNRIGFNEAASENDFLKNCDEAERLIESTKLKYVASTSPIFVLSLLQAATSGIATEIHNSSFAHYYYFLIVGALEKIKIGKQDLNAILTACTHLSWFIRVNGDDMRISRSDYDRFIVDYSEQWTKTDGERLLATLVSARLIQVDGDSIAFTYPYSYYYFLGKFASISQHKPEVSEYIAYCLEHLYARECANTLLFLAHHSGNSAVLDGITAAIDGKFADHAAASLEKSDVADISRLIAQAPVVRYKGIKPNEYRQQQAEERDKYDHGDGLQDKPSDSPRELLHELIGLSKAIEIAGTLLTHQFANYDRQKKNAAIKSMFDGAMRAVKVFHGHFTDADNLVKTLSARAVERQGRLPDEAERSIRDAIGQLLKLVTTSFVIKASSNLRSRELLDNIQRVVDASPTCANRLIKLSHDLHSPSRLPRLDIDRLRKDEANNPAVMGVLQLLMLQRLYMYETDHDDKDWAMSIFDLGAARSAVELRHNARPIRAT